MSAALVSAICDFGGMCKGLPSTTSVDFQKQALALERQINSQLGQYKSLLGQYKLPSMVSSRKHHTLAHSNSVTVPIACPKNSHRKLDRSVSEPADRQQQPRPVQTNSSRYKTELCRPFEESGTCKYGDKCQFAHGINELRTLARHPKYKTELCRTFHTTGFCPYGPRCHFIHNDVAKSLGLGNGSTQRHASVDIEVCGYSPLGELSPNSSSLSGSPPLSNGFYAEDIASSFSPVPQTAPPFITNVGFFDQDFVPFPNAPSDAYLNGGSGSPPEDTLSTSLDNLNLCDITISSTSLDVNRNVRLPIFNQLAFLGAE